VALAILAEQTFNLRHVLIKFGFNVKLATLMFPFKPDQG
jgi:hypothetical protein